MENLFQDLKLQEDVKLINIRKHLEKINDGLFVKTADFRLDFSVDYIEQQEMITITVFLFKYGFTKRVRLFQIISHSGKNTLFDGNETIKLTDNYQEEINNYFTSNKFKDSINNLYTYYKI